MSEGGSVFWKDYNEMVVKIGKACEPLNLFDIGRGWPPANGVSLGSNHHNTCWRHHKFQELDRVSVKKRFLRLDVKMILSEAHKDVLDMDLVYVLRFRVDKDVIQIDQHEVIGHILKDAIHEMLGCCGCLGKAQWHNEELEGSIASLKCCVPLMTQSGASTVIPCTQVRLGVDFG